MPEYAPHSPEKNSEKLPTFERGPEIHHSAERTGEESRETLEKNIERAKTEAEKEAIFGRESAGKKETQAQSDKTAPIITADARKQSFDRTMHQVQSEMSAPARTFSKIIHNPIVERTSDFVGATVARPHAILSGSICACLAVLGLYLTARHYGFALAGSETIIAFMIGWALGIIFDFLRVLIAGKAR